ncbi:preprotein translocase subunit SecD [Sphingomonas sp. PvP055]|uniref:SecDF P1 head subdomain-containing protein n=1 Tax=Sphingomonas sp. PvP055 TaxID=3156391 RepID=UPI003393F875
MATVALRSGVWIGPLHLCHETVRDARVDRQEGRPEAENWDGNDGHLSIMLKPAAAKAYATITRRHLGSPMAVRLGGELISRPRMNVPITEGLFYLTGPEIGVLEDAAKEALGPC